MVTKIHLNMLPDRPSKNVVSFNRPYARPAEPAETADYGEVAKTVYGTAKESPQQIPDAVGRLVKRTAEDTTLKNAIRDGAYFAWIPHGDSCAFCLMLASNGWQRASKKALKGGHAEHIHAHCDCTYMIKFSPEDSVEGYDPEEYQRMYDDAEGDDWQDKVNYLRREQNKKHLSEPLEFNYNGLKEFIPKDAVIKSSRVIAGKESESALRLANKLSEMFGGKPEDWSKLVGKIESEKYIFDIHWYEKDGKMYSPKIKFMKERKK